jgi:hypothetical protein
VEQQGRNDFAHPGRDSSPQFVEDVQREGCPADALALPRTPFGTNYEPTRLAGSIWSLYEWATYTANLMPALHLTFAALMT